MFLFKITNWCSVPNILLWVHDFTNAKKRVFPMLYMKNCLSTLFILHHIFLFFSSCICICIYIYITHIYTCAYTGCSKMMAKIQLLINAFLIYCHKVQLYQMYTPMFRHPNISSWFYINIYLHILVCYIFGW